MSAATASRPPFQVAQLGVVPAGQPFHVLSDSSRVWARVQHPSVDQGDSMLDIVCIDVRDGGNRDWIGRVARLSLRSIVIPLTVPMQAVYVAQ